MNADTLQTELEDAGELMVTVEGIDKPLELHIHDTEIGSEKITLELVDGELVFDLDSVAAYWKHQHSLDDYGL
ncbi:hypothetical protein [Natronobacterium gregoryi]|uniref:Uncharacterized protein n=2 Tax=Natronobacterium gregoryi TaxID=44930 RepID=L0ALH9_NATGS|nr:hypothetical protein [Natronobacterium gregoryi]AFZ74309.1 hypothetical protein Natgr_3179 [Natronobacterium gregoryi SP2]ELY63539.1 hypothetical protein C490_16014 [Natronobacterium gregoryi SP2]PLK22182.1 hypothetical protein CYV19_00460 [Natronobacterium gregoryi SP2]SFI53446.1 hypothetical protein SAMN05443661_101198 [Natronobacterium gregoryi]